MKTNFIANLQAGTTLDNEPFLLHDLVRRKTKDGRPYLLCTLRDKTGQLGGVFWDVPDYIDSWTKTGLVILVTGRLTNFKESLQLNLTDINPATQVSMSDFLPSSRRPSAGMLAELKMRIESLVQPWQDLVAAIMLDEALLPLLVEAPAARGMHHAYIGGLLEHTLSMVAIAEMLASHYDYVNKDLLISGTLLHDIGKTIEYTISGEFSYSEDGRLVGHIVRAIVMVETAAAKLDFPENDLRQLIHLIASHHGTQEWGSPVVPKTLEAILLHQIDLLDSRVQGFMDHIHNDTADETWTTKSSPMFQTELRRPDNMP